MFLALPKESLVLTNVLLFEPKPDLGSTWISLTYLANLSSNCNRISQLSVDAAILCFPYISKLIVLPDKVLDSTLSGLNCKSEKL